VPTAITTVHSGVVAFSIPAVADATCCSPTANSKYGAALANRAATVMCAHSTGERGSDPRCMATTANSSADPSTSRASVTSTGDRPRMPSLIHRKPDPQIIASRAMRTAVARVMS
jgi:hypothetical protein